MRIAYPSRVTGRVRRKWNIAVTWFRSSYRVWFRFAVPARLWIDHAAIEQGPAFGIEWKAICTPWEKEDALPSLCSPFVRAVYNGHIRYHGNIADRTNHSIWQSRGPATR